MLLPIVRGGAAGGADTTTGCHASRNGSWSPATGAGGGGGAQAGAAAAVDIVAAGAVTATSGAPQRPHSVASPRLR